jgi:UDP-glucose 4-epimerase
MNILVTGGAGYIGSITAAELLAAGHRVVIYDNLSKGHREAVSRDSELIVSDIADRDALAKAFRTHRVEAVLHCAALIEAGESMSVPARYFVNNTAGTLTLLETMVACDVPRLVFSSTAAVYGQPRSIPVVESDVLEPTNPYGESKLLVERLLVWFQRIHHLRYASLRYFNAAGAAGELGEAHTPESHLIPIVLSAAMKQRRSVEIYGTDYDTPDGTCIRDYIHIRDLARAHVLALEALGNNEQLIYNLGNGRGFSVREVIDAARKVTGQDIPVVESARRPGDPAVLVASSDKIQRELKWIPQFPELEAIIGSAWEWYRNHPHGYCTADEVAAAKRS